MRGTSHLDVMLALPVFVCSLLTREVDWSVRAESLLASRLRAAMQPWEGAVLLVCGDEVALPHVDLIQSPKVKRDEPGVLRMRGEASGGRCVGLPVEVPVEERYAPFQSLLLL